MRISRVLVWVVLSSTLKLLDAWSPLLPLPHIVNSPGKSLLSQRFLSPNRCAPPACGKRRFARRAQSAAIAKMQASDGHKSSVEVYDTTLTQHQVDLSPEDKIRIVERLHRFGMHYIEGGWPVVAPRDRIFFMRARTELSPDIVRSLVAMARPPVGALEPSRAKVLATLLETGAGNIGLVLDTLSAEGLWLSQLDVDETIKFIADLKAALLARTPPGGRAGAVLVQMHNFFDAYREDSGRALSLVLGVARAGSPVSVVLVDSSGGSTPWELEPIVVEVVSAVGKEPACSGVRVGLSCQNEADLAVAGALHGVRAGASIVQGSVNGFDMSTNLVSVVPVLQVLLACVRVCGHSHSCDNTHQAPVMPIPSFRFLPPHIVTVCVCV